MKKCQKCHALNEDDDKFCRACGQKLQQQSEKRKNRKSWIAGAVLLAAVLCAALFFLNNNEEKPDYQETIAMAEKYLEELDYSKAEELLLEAREIDPRQQKPYEELYRIYTIQEQPEKAERIRESASENLPEEDRKTFEEIAEVIEVDEKPDPERKTVAELGSLDYPPISLDGKSWLLIKDGKFSFLYPDGTLKDAVNMERFFVFKRTSTDQVLSACFSSGIEGGLSQKDSYEYGDYIPDTNCGGGIPLDSPYILNDQNEVEVVPSELTAEYRKMDSLGITSPIVVSHSNDAEGEYYIYNPADQKLYGPYDPNTAAAFYKMIPSLEEAYSLGLNQAASSPFWVKNENPDLKENGVSDLYTVFSKDGSKSENGFSNVMIIDPFSIGVFKSKRFYLLDENLKSLYDGIFEAGACPIDGKVPVKIDGQWKLMDLNEKDKDEEKEEDQKEDQKTEDPISAEYQGEYIKRGGRWSSVMQVAADGTVNGSAQIGYAYENTDEYPKGTVHQMEYTARFEILQKESPGQPTRIRLTDISLKKPVGTEEIIDGFRYVAEGGDLFYLYNGQEYLLYPAGTRYGDLPQEVLDSNFPRESADQTLPSPCLILNESPQLVFMRN